MKENENENVEFINPIDKDNITETPNTLTYSHHRGGFPIIPSKQGDIKHKALSAMQEQTNTQLLQIKEQMETLAMQANKIKTRIELIEDEFDKFDEKYQIDENTFNDIKSFSVSFSVSSSFVSRVSVLLFNVVLLFVVSSL